MCDQCHQDEVRSTREQLIQCDHCDSLHSRMSTGVSGGSVVPQPIHVCLSCNQLTMKRGLQWPSWDARYCRAWCRIRCDHSAGRDGHPIAYGNAAEDYAAGGQPAVGANMDVVSARRDTDLDAGGAFTVELVSPSQKHATMAEDHTVAYEDVSGTDVEYSIDQADTVAKVHSLPGPVNIRRTIYIGMASTVKGTHGELFDLARKALQTDAELRQALAPSSLTGVLVRSGAALPTRASLFRASGR